ncbi:MAG TPA: hypothetical protein VFZ73_03830 [Gemmatimonadaceae bacterium]
MGAGTLDWPVCLVDAHVHLHPEFDTASFLEHATRNFVGAARDVRAPLHAGVLLLAESPGEAAFERIGAIAMAGPRWTIRRTAEPGSIVISGGAAAPLIVIAGRQLVTAEGVEVLALMTDQDLPHGASLTRTLDLVRQCGAIPVLPWGFGKWAFRRGRLVAQILRSEGDVLVGDNAGRWRLGRSPRLFAVARDRSVRVLPGTDPLPFRSQEAGAGSYGFVVPQPIDFDHPARDLRDWLRLHRGQPRAYGTLASTGVFVWNQLRMQWRKRVRRSR